jgi:hypothetical protein
MVSNHLGRFIFINTKKANINGIDFHQLKYKSCSFLVIYKTVG